jgi:hypothetical protein
MLRDARRTLPDPDEHTGRRVRRAVVAAVGRRRLPLRTMLAAAAAIAAASAIGFGFGQRIGPEPVQAAQPGGVFGAGFLPADGWNTFQHGRRHGAAALAANVPLESEDVARGTGVLPLATLRTLPARGTVIVAALDPQVRAAASGQKLPLRIADSAAEIVEVGGRTLLVHRLRARVDAYTLDVSVFFGARAPSREAIEAAQRQLQRLVVEAPKVTIRAELRTTPGQSWRRWVDVSGTIASSAAGETVEVHARDCTARTGAMYRLVGTARSLPGGSWKLTTVENGVIVPGIPTMAFYRARWDGTFSEPVQVRVPLYVGAVFVKRQRRVMVLINTRETGQNLTGKTVRCTAKSLVRRIFFPD